MHADSPYLDNQYTAFGKVTSGHRDGRQDRQRPPRPQRPAEQPDEDQEDHDRGEVAAAGDLRSAYGVARSARSPEYAGRGTSRAQARDSVSTCRDSLHRRVAMPTPAARSTLRDLHCLLVALRVIVPREHRRRPRADAPALRRPLACRRARHRPRRPRTVADDHPARRRSRRCTRASWASSYKPEDAAKLHDAHVLLEQFFAEPPRQERKADHREAPRHEARPQPPRPPHADPHALAGARSRASTTSTSGIGPHDVRYFLGVPKGYDRTKPLAAGHQAADGPRVPTDPMPAAERRSRQIYSDWIKDELKPTPTRWCSCRCSTSTSCTAPATPG